MPPRTATITLGVGVGEASAVPAIVAASGIVTPSVAASVTDTHDVRSVDRTPCMTGASAPHVVTLRVVPSRWSGDARTHYARPIAPVTSIAVLEATVRPTVHAR